MSLQPTAPRRKGPVVIGYDGSPVADRALAEAAGLLSPRTALVVTVWEAGRAFESAWPVGIEVPVPVVDIRAALEMEQAAYETAERTAMQGAGRAMAMGLRAESRGGSDETSNADTHIRGGAGRDAAAKRPFCRLSLGLRVAPCRNP